MNTLIIARHGIYNSRTGQLYDIGQDQIKALGREIKEKFLNGGGIVPRILSSTAPRAIESAEIVGSIVGVSEIEFHDTLWTGPDSPRGDEVDTLGGVLLIKKKDAPVIILVSHLEFSEDLPDAFGQVVLQEPRSTFRRGRLEKGQAWVIDCQQKSMQRLSPPGT